MRQQLISIIMPTYNADKFIKFTIDSVCSQNYKNWELIVVDDCSTDATCDVVKSVIKIDSRVKLISLEENCGAPARPRNIGVRNSLGDWVAFLDADDVWHPKKLMLQMQAIYKYKTDFCSSEMMNFSKNNEIEFLPCNSTKLELVTFKKQLIKHITPISSVLAKKDLFCKFPFNEEDRYRAREDVECCLRIHENIKSSVKLNCTLLFYRISDDQISKSKWRMLLKNYMVLNEYRTISGKGLGWKKYYYWTTQVIFSFYYRLIKKTL